MNNRGVSEIVTAVLFIAIAVTLLTIVFLYVRNTTVLLNPDTDKCVDFQINPPVRIRSACYDSGSGEVIVGVSRISLNHDINELLFSIDSTTDGKTTSWSCGDPLCTTCKIVDTGNSKNYYFSVLEEFSSPDDINSVKVLVDGCFVESKRIVDC